MFDPLWESGSYTLQGHGLDHLVEDMERFGTLQVLDSIGTGWYDVHGRSWYSRTSKLHASEVKSL